MRDMAEQLNRDAATPTGEDTSVEGRPVLVSDEITNRQARSGKPTWAVEVVGKDGGAKPVLAASGKPMRWNPDHARAFEKNLTPQQNDSDLDNEVNNGGSGNDILNVTVPGGDEADTKTGTELDAGLGDEVMDVEISDEDAKKLNQIEVDLNALGSSQTKEQIIQFGEKYGEMILSILPITSNVISARDAYLSFLAAKKAVENGDYSDAAIQAAFTAVNVIGAIPVGGAPVGWIKAVAKGLSKGRAVVLNEVAKESVKTAVKKGLKASVKLPAARETGKHIRKKLYGLTSGKKGRAVGRKLEKSSKPAKTTQVIKAFQDALTINNTARSLKGYKAKNKAEFTPEDIAPGMDEAGAIEGFVEAWLDGDLVPGRNQIAQLNLGPVNEEFAARLKVDTGMDVSGMSHRLDTQKLIHAWGDHGPDGETDVTQEPISPEALSIYRHAVENYDRVFPPKDNERGDTVTFEKDVNGTIIIVQQKLNDRKEFAFLSMYIKKRNP